MIKKIQLDDQERDLIRHLLECHIQQHIEGLQCRGYSNTGIPKICQEITLIGGVLNKLKFEVLE